MVFGEISRFRRRFSSFGGSFCRADRVVRPYEIEKPRPENRGEVDRGTTLIALARILAALYRERPPESSSGCSELAAIKARRRASTFPLLSKGCCLMLGSSLQKPISQIFYHKLRQCQPLSRNFTKNSIFRTAPPRAARSSLPEPASEALPESASAAFSAP